MIHTSAPGKLMLLGEHAVVYGRPCLVTAVDARLHVEFSPNDVGKIIINAPQVTDTRFIDAAINSFQRKYKLPAGGFTITTNSPFSGKYGFGSSSAVTVATVAALIKFINKPLNPKIIFQIAYEAVMDVQKIGSGFDVAAAAFGGYLFYIKGGKDMHQVYLTDKLMPLVIGYSGVKSNSVDIVNNVAIKKEKYPERVERIFSGITKLVIEAEDKIKEHDWPRLGRLFDFNQEYLRDLGVTTEKLEILISAAKNAGAWGAKLSGAGGGDCMIALCSPDKYEKVKTAITNAGGEVVDIRAGSKGVSLDNFNDEL